MQEEKLEQMVSLQRYKDTDYDENLLCGEIGIVCVLLIALSVQYGLKLHQVEWQA